MLRQHAGLLIRDVRVQISVEGPIWDRGEMVITADFYSASSGFESLRSYHLVKRFAQARNTSVESLSALGCEKSELSLPQLLGMRIRKRQREETECFTKW